MPSSLLRGRWLVAILAGALVVTGGLAYAAIPDTGGIIHSCYTKSSGAWRVIDTGVGQTCKANEAALDLYSKGGADALFLGKTEKAADSDRLDGQDSAAFLGASAKAADSDKLDGKDSTEFLAANATAADSNRLGGFLSRAYVLGGGYLVSDVRSVVDSGTWSFGCCLPGDTSPPITFKFTCDTDGGSKLLVSSPERFRWWWDDTFGEAAPAASGYETEFGTGNGAERHTLRATELLSNSSTTLDWDTSIDTFCVFAWTHMKTQRTIPGP